MPNEPLSAADENPRKKFEDAVNYAVQLAHDTLRVISQRTGKIKGLRYLELGPGAEFAPQLVLASMGVEVSLVDRFLAKWDPAYHPDFYRAFLERWTGEKAFIEKAIQQSGYDRLLHLAAEGVERMHSFGDGQFDFVLSNAVLEHIMDFPAAVQELARVTRPGGIHAHQVDFRDHRNYAQPFEYLLMSDAEFQTLRVRERGTVGTTMRFPEMLDAFAADFWIWQTEIPTSGLADAAYSTEIQRGLSANNRYASWPEELFRVASMRMTLVRKGPR